MKTAIVTGSGGLIGSAASGFLLKKGYRVIGVDNDMRKYFFGDSASTIETQHLLSNDANFVSISADIREYEKLRAIFADYAPEIVIHTAAQPSHDWAAKEPLTDFTVNALGTMNMLELTRLYCPSATFIFTSTNKVYGDTPNHSPYIQEWTTRYECVDDMGNPTSIDEHMSIDQTKHSVFGASKVAADIMVQEYGRYFGMNTVVFRGGCLTGPAHAGTELHGFLSYLIKCMVHRRTYTIFGYKGNQVRDNIYSEDLIQMFWEYHLNPRPGEVYNAGGGRENSVSILEAIDEVNRILEERGEQKWDMYTVEDRAREGDHIWYVSDLRKFRTHYPNWKLSTNIKEIIKLIVENELRK